MILTQKETDLLNDLKSQEDLCIQKYQKASSEACDAALKTLFSQIGQVEQQHLNTLNQIASGSVPTPASGGDQSISQPSSAYGIGQNEDKKKDCYLCSDLLATEKHASSLYDTCIFEFKDTGIRNVLNHIQKEEQGHGEKIYNYMAQNNMYS